MTDQAPKRPRGRPAGSKNKANTKDVTVTADDAVMEALERGEEVHATVDSKGETIYQRPVSLTDPGVQPLNPGKRVKVYNRHGAAVFTSDMKVEAGEQAEVLETDLVGNCADWLLKIA